MKILFTGDVMLGRLVDRRLKKAPPEYPWGDTLPVFEKADLRICNLECVISDKGEPWGDKAFYFRTGAKNIKTLEAASIDAVSIANNHTLDYGPQAMREMLSVLDRAGIARAGAGMDSVEARRPAVIEKSGMKISLVSFTDNEPDWEAGPHNPGVFHVPVTASDMRADDLFGIVAAAKKTSDLVVVAAHWGPNWGCRPPKSHVPFGRSLAEAGAGIVFGHSAHVFRGIEYHRGSAILYSTGDFVDDYAVDADERNDESFIFVAEADKNRVTGVRLYPTVIEDFQARMAKGGQARDIARKMSALCAELGSGASWSEEDGCLEVTPRPQGQPRSAHQFFNK